MLSERVGATAKIIFLGGLCIGVCSLALSGCANKCNPDKEYLVVTTWGGMANRLRMLVSSQIMAEVSARQMVVDWPIDKNEMVGEWKDFFENPLTVFAESSLKSQGCSWDDITSATPSFLIKNLNVGDIPKKQRVISLVTEYSEPIIYFAGNFTVKASDKYLSQSNFEERQRLWYKNLRPIPWITNSVNQFKKDNKFDSYYMIGIHYRSWQLGTVDSDVVGDADPNNKYIPEFITKMKAALAKPLSDTDNKPVAFYLSTDSEKAKQDIMAVPEFKDRVFARSEKADRSTIKGQQSDMVDFFLLGSTNYIIGTFQSSFSEEAAHLTKQDRKENIGEAVYK